MLHGATLIPEFDVNAVTHIVSDASEATTLKVLGLKSWKPLPDHIPTVKWGWMVVAMTRPSSMSKADVDRVLREKLCDHAIVSDRMFAGMEPIVRRSGINKNVKGKGKEKEKSASNSDVVDDGFSYIS